MLLAIRERIMGVVGWIVLGLLFVTFLFFGLNSYLTSSAENYAARVNDAEISPAEHQRAYEQLVARMRQMLGEAYDPEQFDESLLKSNALTKLINEELILQTADDEGFAASDRLVAAQISAVEEFKKDGVFSKERYAQMLRYQGMSPGQFEWRLQREVISNQLKAGIILTASSTEDDLRRAYALQGQLRRFNYLVLPAASVEDSLEITDSDIEQYYPDHPDECMTEEQVRVAYLELNATELDVDRVVTEEEIAARYDEQSDDFVTPEQRRARHMLITATGDTAEDIEAARAKAEQVIERLEQGEEFAAVAAETSDDTASVSAGGDLGFFGRDIMVPEFEAAAFSMDKGERSQPIQSSFGFHVIELLEIEAEVATPLEEVRDELVASLLEADRNDLFYEQSETLSNIAFEQPNSLQGIVDALGLEIQESDWVTRAGGNGIAENSGVVEAAFSDDVLKNGYNSQAVEISEDHIVVVRLLEHQEAALQALEDVREQVHAALRVVKIRAMLEEKGQRLLAELRSGAIDLASLAENEDLEPGTTNLLLRNSEIPSRALVSKAFALPGKASDSPVYEGMHLPEGDYALLELQEVQDGKYDELPEAGRKQVWRSLNEIQGTNEMLMVISELKAQADIQMPDSGTE
jgi:peptidyl-prolyl cis-trans isomerase D